jgi:hypothetical protein
MYEATQRWMTAHHLVDLDGAREATYEDVVLT